MPSVLSEGWRKALWRESNQVLCNACCGPSPGPGGLVLACCKTLPTTLGSRWSHTHFTDKEIEAHSFCDSTALLMYSSFVNSLTYWECGRKSLILSVSSFAIKWG